MNLDTRLKKLEIAERLRSEHVGPDPTRALVETLERYAERLAGTEITPAFCARESAATVFAICYDDLGTGQHRFPAWARCNELTAMDGAPGKAAQGLVDIRARGLREVGLNPDVVFSALSEAEVVA